MDERTKRHIQSLHVLARPWAEAHLAAIEASGLLPHGWRVEIVSGNRTWAQQDALYAQGRTVLKGSRGETLDVVTNARGGQSNHNFGIAWDIGLFDANGRYLKEHSLYATLGPVGEALGLEWGGRWKSFRGDKPHYQIRTGLTTAELRSTMRRGKSIPIPRLGHNEPAAPLAGDVVRVFDEEKETSIAAYLDGGRVYVAVRPFVAHFGGWVVAVEGNTAIVQLHDEQISLSGTIKDGVMYAKFIDLNRALQWGYRYEAGRLHILTGSLG